MQAVLQKALYVRKEGWLNKVSVKEARVSEWQPRYFILKHTTPSAAVNRPKAALNRPKTASKRPPRIDLLHREDPCILCSKEACQRLSFVFFGMPYGHSFHARPRLPVPHGCRYLSLFQCVHDTN